MSKQKPEEQRPDGMDSLEQKDNALFEALGKSKKQKKRRIIRTILIVVAIVAIVLVVGVSALQRRVRTQFASNVGDVLSHTVSTGTISTVVSGSGTLANVDTETVDLITGVEIEEMLVDYGDRVEEGDLLATVDMATVQTAMSDLQTQIEELDDQISDAEGDRVSSNIQSGVSGRVKILYAEKGEDVAAAMVDHGALAVISLDGYMALDLETDALSAGDSVTVTCADGNQINGSVSTVIAGKTTILVTDNGPVYDEEVTVLAEDGTELGSAKLYIHNPLAVTGFAGTINAVRVKENQNVYSTTVLFSLTDTSYSANYDSLLRTRSEAEETLLELLKWQRYGGVTAPVSGSVFSVADLDSEEITEVVTLSPDVSMSVTIGVDESDILSLELDQQADVTVSSVTEDILTGTVTEIDKTASSGSYTAVITLDKIEGMLPGMTASVDVRIEGVDDAIIIPVDALHQTSTGAFVYTTYDGETQEYGGRVDVVTGLSNSNYVEIKSGLQAGDTVYYTESQSFADFFAGMGGFRGGNRGGQSGGDFGGGQMPAGDFGGGQSGGAMPAMPAEGGRPSGFGG